MSAANRQVAVSFIEAFSRADTGTVKKCLSPEAVVHSKGFGKLSGTRTYEFIVATTSAFKDIMPSGLQPKILSVIAEGDRVVVEFEGNATLSNGEPYRNQYCFILTFAAGRIKQVHEYYCTVLADEKIGPLLQDIEQRRKASQR
jgi:ketosteroid isomerase-like protein